MENSILNEIRVVESARYVAAPLTGRILAALGAEVIKVETNQPLDYQRLDADGTKNGYRWPDSAALKLSVTLDLRHPEGLRIMKELLKVSDVFIESFRPEGLAELGLEYPAIQQINPRIIMVRMPGFGLAGPYRDFVAYGMAVQALGGLCDTTGFPDSLPIGPNLSFPDYFSGVNTALAVLAALDFRRRTGKGQVIEAPLYLAMTSVMGPASLDFSANLRVAKRMGNRDPYACPHGAYKCQGNDRWCVMAIRSDKEWANFCQAIGNPDWANKPEFATLLARRHNADELDRYVEAWTSAREVEDVVEVLQKAGVPAGIVTKGSDMLSDPHLKEREYWKTSQHPRYGSHPTFPVPIGFSKTPCVFGPSPKLGEHNDYVYGKVLGLSKGEIKRLTEAAVFA